jgi:hypothetical protein
VSRRDDQTCSLRRVGDYHVGGGSRDRYLKNVDRHNEWTVSAFIAGNGKYMTFLPSPLCAAPTLFTLGLVI